MMIELIFLPTSAYLFKNGKQTCHKTLQAVVPLLKSPLDPDRTMRGTFLMNGPTTSYRPNAGGQKVTKQDLPA
jgi:hypothetical protein